MKLKQVVIVVSGKTRFPLDMLRYDRLTFESEEDANVVQRSLCDVSLPEIAAKDLSVGLVGWLHGNEGYPSSVTADRWKSFGWKIESVEIDGKAQRVYS